MGRHLTSLSGLDTGLAHTADVRAVNGVLVTLGRTAMYSCSGCTPHNSKVGSKRVSCELILYEV